MFIKTNTYAYKETIEILNDFILWDCDCAQSFLENFKHYLGEKNQISDYIYQKNFHSRHPW